MNLLITDCLQTDFVGPIGRYQSLPNELHIGHDESLRLLGSEPLEGPVARMMKWAHEQPTLRLIHIRDWHDETVPEQRSHLQQFGTHCLHGSAGAAFVFEVPTDAKAALDIVDATGLSNFVDTNLASLLEPLKDDAVRVGLMGVWTEAKISFLAYDLRARYPKWELAVCSALTASSSRAQHHAALDQMERILGVRVVDSVGEFVEYLGGTMESVPLIGFTEKHPELLADQDAQLSDVDRRLTRYLFRGCKRVTVNVLDGGFSGNVVLGTESVDHHGHEEVPHVVKIGPSELIGDERTAFERIQAVLGNTAPQIAEHADLQGRGAIKYRYAAMGAGKSTSFQAFYSAGTSQREVDEVLDRVFNEQLGRLYRAAASERIDLLKYYDFSSKWAPSVRSKVVDLIGAEGEKRRWLAPHGAQVTNIADFYEDGLESLPRIIKSHYVGYVHGDLNGANILIDPQSNVWLIDFFHTHRGHVLKDLAKLENDVLYIYTQLETENDLVLACHFSDWLLEIRDLHQGLAALPDAIAAHDQLGRAAETVSKLRQFYPDLVHSDRDPSQLLIAQVRYAVHTLGFEESSVLQRQWALYSAAKAAEILKRRLTQAGPLRIDWMPAQYSAPGKVGMTILPGRKDYQRDLESDLDTISSEGVTAVVCLLSRDEFERLGVNELLDRYRANGLDVFHVPIVDQRTPSLEEAQRATNFIKKHTQAGAKVLVHCVGGVGRAGTIVSCWLTLCGLSAKQAIDTVRQSRSPRAVETKQQAHLVESFAKLAS